MLSVYMYIKFSVRCCYDPYTFHSFLEEDKLLQTNSSIMTFESLNQVHCQGGKGRTGTFCAALLLWTGFSYTANEALDIFARRRTDPRLGRRRNLQGVDSPSQRRCIKYLESALQQEKLVFPPAPRRTLLTCVTLASPPSRRSSTGGVARVCFIVECCGTVQYDRGKRHGGTPLPDRGHKSSGKRKSGGQLRFELEDATFVAGDVTVRFFLFDEDGPSPQHGAEVGPGGRTVRYGDLVGRQLCFVTFNTAYHGNGENHFASNEVDGAYDKAEQDFPADFAIIITLNESMGLIGPRSPILMPAKTMPFLDTCNLQPLAESTEESVIANSKCGIQKNPPLAELESLTSYGFSSATHPQHSSAP